MTSSPLNKLTLIDLYSSHTAASGECASILQSYSKSEEVDQQPRYAWLHYEPSPPPSEL